MKILVSTVLLTAGLLTGCAGLIVAPVSDSDRDTTNSYDGRWNLDIAYRYREFKSGDSRKRFKCDIKANTVVLEVQNGVAQLEGRPSGPSTNVAANGTFRLEMPTDQILQQRSGLREFNSDLTIIYKGTLAEEGSVGAFVHGRGSAKKADCSAPMTIEKLS